MSPSEAVEAAIAEAGYEISPGPLGSGAPRDRSPDRAADPGNG